MRSLALLVGAAAAVAGSGVAGAEAEVASASATGAVSKRATLRVRLFWVRHGQSCANVLDRCAVKPPESNELLRDVEEALRLFPGGQFKDAKLNKTFGVAAATDKEKDCTVEITGSSGLVSGRTGDDGAVVRVHDLYTDPALTDCARRQSQLGGRSFLRWLRRAGIKLDFVGSSFLMRAFETACAMFLAPCSGQGRTNCTGVVDASSKVTPVPYLTERAPRGMTALQADNMPREVDVQSKMIEAAYGRQLPIDSTYAKTWPRYAQQFEKFKAFLATQIVPGLRAGLPGLATAAPAAAFQAALEAALPETMRHEDHGKDRISFKWSGGSYATGPGFTKAEYAAMDAPEVNLALVGHNQMMMEYCQEGQLPKPNNNAVLEKLFILEASAAGSGSSASADVVFRELSTRCAKVMDAPDGGISMRSLVDADVATCATPFEVSKFMGLEKGRSPEDTACVRLAAAEGAYPIQPEFASMGAAVDRTRREL